MVGIGPQQVEGGELVVAEVSRGVIIGLGKVFGGFGDWQLYRIGLASLNHKNRVIAFLLLLLARLVLSLSPGPAPLERAEHLKKYANLWRVTDDFWDDWNLLRPMFERTEKWCVHAGPGHWPDQDMLPVGALRQCTNPDDRTHFTRDEQITMMTLWCMARSPLMIGAEMPKMDEWTLSLLTNRKVLAVLNETCAARMLRRTDEDCVMIAYRKNGQGAYVARFNLCDEARPVPVRPDSIEVSFSSWEELWSGKTGRGALPEAALPAHGAEVYRLK